MFIQIYTANFFPEPTGTGKYTGEMAAWLAAAGHRVEVICGFPYYPEWTLAPPHTRTRFLTEHWRGVTIRRVPHYIPPKGGVTSLRRMLVDFTIGLGSAVHALRTLCSREAPDVMMAICPPMFSGLWPMLIGAIRRRPWVFHVQDFQVDAAVRLGMLWPRWLGRVLLAMEAMLLRAASRVSSITPAMNRLAVSKGVAADHIFELPNWSDLQRVRPIDSDTAFRRELGATAAQTVVMYAGAMGRKQGLPLVLDAAQALQGDPRFVFVMIGSGSDADELRRDAARRGLANIRFLPLQPLERLGEVLGSADVHLVIQKADAADLVMPSKLTNILAAGRPAVATTLSGTALWDAVHGQQTGLAIAPEAPDALVLALRTLAADADLRARLGGNARAYAERDLGQDAILRRLDELLQQLAGQPPAAKKPKEADDAA